MTTAKMKNEPAFPTANYAGGMTLRDYFAAKALQGYIAGEYDVYPHEKVERAYAMADLMLEERRK